MTELLGRTNRAFPRIWLSLSVPEDFQEIDALVDAAIASGLPLDVTSQPALWGGRLRGHSPILTAISSSHFEDANDEAHACDLVQAHLIEILSCLGRETLDFYFLRVRRQVEEYQISGALQAMELARQEGHLRYLGIFCDGPAFATLGLWQFHDAFDVLLAPRNHYSDEAYRTLAPVAKERRVGVITSSPLNWGYGVPFVSLPPASDTSDLAKQVLSDLSQSHPVMVGVRSAQEVQQALEAIQLEPNPSVNDLLLPIRHAFDDEAMWDGLLAGANPRLVRAAQKRQAENQ